jgi:hypothetical protein
MALAVDPSLLTAAEQAKRKAAAAAAAKASTSSISQRRRYQAALKASTKAVGATRAAQTYNPKYYSAAAQEKAARGRYDAAQAALKAFTGEYDTFNKLGTANPTQAGVLNQLLPFDPQGAAERLAAQKALDQQLLTSKQGRDELAQDYTTGQAQLNQEQPGRYRALLSNFAGRGLANSSGYATAFGDESADFAKRQTDLSSQNQRGLAQYGLADSAAQADFQSNIAGVLSGITGRLSGSAGQLGMAGNANLPLLLELARRRLAAGG